MFKLSKKQLEEMKPCDLERRLAMFGRKRSLNVADALSAGARVGDILWVAGRLGLSGKIVEFAVRAKKRAQGYAAEIEKQKADLIELFSNVENADA